MTPFLNALTPWLALLLAVLIIVVVPTAIGEAGRDYRQYLKRQRAHARWREMLQYGVSNKDFK